MESRPGAGGQQLSVKVSCQIEITVEWAYGAKNSNQGIGVGYRNNASKTDAIEGAGKVAVNDGLERPRQPYSQQKENDCGKEQDLGEGIGIDVDINQNNQDCYMTNSSFKGEQDVRTEAAMSLGEDGSDGHLSYEPMDVDT